MFQSEIVTRPSQLEMEIPKWKNRKVGLSSTRRLDLVLPEQTRLRCGLEEVLDNMRKGLQMVELCSLRSPFLPSTFQTHRRQAFLALQKLTKDSSPRQQHHLLALFSAEVDGHMLPVFLERLKEPYWEAVMSERVAMPVKVERSQVESYVMDEEGRLASAVSQWCIAVEVTYDLVQRAVLYGLLDDPQLQLHHLQSSLTPHSKFSIGGWSRSFFNKVLVMFTRSLSKKVVGNSPLAQLQSLVEHFGVACTLMVHVVGRQAFPWSTLKSIGLPALPYLLGGYLGTRLTAKLVNVIQSRDISRQVQQFTTLFQEVTQNISLQNERLSDKMKGYLEAGEKEREGAKEEVKRELERVTAEEGLHDLMACSPSPDYLPYQHEMASLKIDQMDDWTTLQKVDIQEQPTEEGFSQVNFI